VLGYPLVTHIVAQHFRDRLSEFFRACVLNGKGVAADSYGRILEDLWDGLSRTLERSGVGYLAEAARFSRIVARDRTPVGTSISGGAWLAEFRYDMAQIIGGIIERPASPVSATQPLVAREWHVIRRDDRGRLTIARLPRGVGSRFEGSGDDLGATFVDLREVSHVEGRHQAKSERSEWIDSAGNTTP